VSDLDPADTGGFRIGFAAGLQVAGYRLDAEIGRGGTALVYRAREERLGRLVALKILAPELAEDETFRHWFIQQLRAVSAVSNPHIIPVFEAGQADGMLFIAMRYVPGGDARSLARREGPLPPGRVAAIIWQVASALDAMHAAGLLHRDVKPTNMLVESAPGRPDRVYLSDFGLSSGAVSMAGPARTRPSLNTLACIAPELIEGNPADGRADEYALAASAFELFSGWPPFRPDDAATLLRAHVSQPPPRLTVRRPELPAEVDAVLATALAKNPEHRYASCREFAATLAEALGLRPAPPGLIPPSAERSGPGARPAPEAGSALEAGPAPEAGPALEAGSALDAGPAPEAGPALEAGSALDAGPAPEAGPALEAGSALDAGPAPEARRAAGGQPAASDAAPGTGLPLETVYLAGPDPAPGAAAPEAPVPGAPGPGAETADAGHPAPPADGSGSRGAHRASGEPWLIRRQPPSRRLTQAAAVIGVVAVLLVVAAVLSATGVFRSSPPKKPPPPPRLASFPIAVRSALPPVSGLIRVIYHSATAAQAQVYGEVKGSTRGDVARLYAQPFPYTSAPVAVASAALQPQHKTAPYAFPVTPSLATRYQVKVFQGRKGTRSLASSATTTVYVTAETHRAPGASCVRPVCRKKVSVAVFVPPSAMSTEISKPWYAYFGLSLSKSATIVPPLPTVLQLGAGAARAGARQVSADEFVVTVTLAFNVGKDGYSWTWTACDQGTVTVDGLGLPGHYGCGDKAVPARTAYLG
jgi:hypothetical protein